MGLAGWGIWVFCQQASATICLFESFTQSAFMRLLIQVKDNQSSEAYKKLIWLGLLSFCSQGVLIFLIHLGLATTLPRFFPNFENTSTSGLILIMGFSALINQMGKINGQLLYAHQQQDVAAVAATTGLLVNLLVVLTFLPTYPNPQTMGWGFLAGSVSSQVLYWIFVKRRDYYPFFADFPIFQWVDFQGLFFWGRKFFLVSFLNNLSGSLPTLLAGRFLSLELVGVWGVLQRIGNLASQLLLKIPQLAIPALMEMHARGEEQRFRKRSQQLLWMQNVLAGIFLGIFAGAGDFLLSLWISMATPIPGLILCIFALGLLADFDQRLRFDLEATRFQLNRPTLASFIKIASTLLCVPLCSVVYGLSGMVAALSAIYALLVLPLAFVNKPFRDSYSLTATPTIAGLSVFLFFYFLLLWMRSFVL